jgi:hypothetical protein
MLADQADHVLGIDTHRDSHSAAILAADTAVVQGQITVAANERGYRRLLRFARESAPGRRAWTVEGTGSYGAGLTVFLQREGELVLEVDRPRRPARRDRAKSDELDAIRAAREALTREHLARPRQRGEREALRVLLATRDSAVRSKRAAITLMKGLLVSAAPTLREGLRSLPTSEQLTRCARLRINPTQDSEQRATTIAIRASARRALALAEEAQELEAEIKPIVVRLAPCLLAEMGVGAIVAAQILCAYSHQGRIRSEAAFASLAGVAPIPASSGQTVRHRLNRSGDRQLNRALHTIVLCRMRDDARTRAYTARRQAEGRSTREIKRCLKRYTPDTSTDSSKPHLRISQIARLDKHRSIMPAHTRRWAERVLAQLTSRNLTAFVRPGRRGARLYYLTLPGAQAVEMIPTRVETRRKLITPEQAAGPLWKHTLAVNDVGIAFLKAARERGDDFGPLGWRREIAQPAPAAGRARTELLIADALLTYLELGPAHELTFHYRLLELDRATVPTDTLASKLARYADLYHHALPGHGQAPGPPAWQARYPIFPEIICVLAGQPRAALTRRAQTVLALCREDPQLKRTPEVRVSLALFDDLQTDGPFAPIWHQIEDPARRVDWLRNRPSGVSA